MLIFTKKLVYLIVVAVNVGDWCSLPLSANDCGLREFHIEHDQNVAREGQGEKIGRYSVYICYTLIKFIDGLMFSSSEGSHLRCCLSRQLQAAARVHPAAGSATPQMTMYSTSIRIIAQLGG